MSGLWSREQRLRRLFSASWTKPKNKADELIGILDRHDGDPDLEPSLGYHPPDYPPHLVDAEYVPPAKAA